MGSFLRSPPFSLLVVLATSLGAHADREEYLERDSVMARSGRIQARHIHDYAYEQRELRVRLSRQECGIFTAANTYSFLGISSNGGKTWVMAPSPPLTALRIDPKQKVVIGLSRIKLHNPYHAVVFDLQGKLLYWANIPDETFGFHDSEFSRFHHDDSIWLRSLSVMTRQNDST